jgi:hypothetical protein
MSFGTKGCMYCEGECNKECLSQEESKQETIEEAAARYACSWGEDDDEKSFIAGAKSYAARDYWFKQFKKD